MNVNVLQYRYNRKKGSIPNEKHYDNRRNP